MSEAVVDVLPPSHANPALLLGAGGSARAIAAALQDAGIAVTITNRTPERAQALARDLPGLKELRAAGLLDSRPNPGEAQGDTDEDEGADQAGQSELFEE